MSEYKEIRDDQIRVINSENLKKKTITHTMDYYHFCANATFCWNNNWGCFTL